MSEELDDVKEFATLSETFDSKQRFADELSKQPVSSIASGEVGTTKDSNPGRPTQYSLYGAGYMPTTHTIPTLPSDCYDIYSNNDGIFVVKALKPSGLILELPGMRSEYIINSIENFWNSENDYKLGNEFVIGGASFKGGMMIWGPPGGGKSSTIKIVTKKLVEERKGVVFYASEAPTVLMEFLKDFSTVEPDRKCIVILEDFDSLIKRYGDHVYLEILDSAKSINNVYFIATTNYPELLDPRIYNRPGRFSRVVKVGLPGDKARETYLKAILKNHRDVEEIVNNTEGFTIDHLTQLINSVYREKNELSGEIQRLRALFKAPKDIKEMGIGAKHGWNRDE